MWWSSQINHLDEDNPLGLMARDKMKGALVLRCLHEPEPPPYLELLSTSELLHKKKTSLV